jgi:hypothetical protein
LKVSATTFHLVMEGTAAVVLVSDDVKVQYDAVLNGTDVQSVKRRTQLNRYLKEFCSNEPHRLSDLQYKKEGNYKDGHGKTVAIWTFKPTAWRLYGAVLKVNGKKAFVGVEVDPSKKRDKANKKLLESAALLIGKLEEHKG